MLVPQLDFRGHASQEGDPTSVEPILVATAMNDQLVQPSLQRTSALEAFEFGPDVDENLLDDVLGILGHGQQSSRQHQQPFLVSFYDLLEGRDLSSDDPPSQLVVARLRGLFRR